MVKGIKVFKEYFKESTDGYVVIGGTACDILTTAADFEPRATDDIDVIIIVEALKVEFVEKFWQFVIDGEYNLKQKDFETRKCYRFLDPKNTEFPKQIELFCKAPDMLKLLPDAYLTPIPVGEGLSSLSAILLNEQYYKYTVENSIIVEDIHLAKTEALICLKAFAYLDNKRRKEEGQEVNKRDVVKHKHDVFRLVFLLKPDDVFELPEIIKIDLQKFADVVKNDLPDPAIFKENGFGNQNMITVYNQMIKCFDLK
jgi:hypothetical protein